MKFPKKTLIVVFISIGVLILSGYQFQSTRITTAANEEETSLIRGKISDQTAVDQCLALLQKNLTAANEKNVEDYVQTLVKDAQEPTRKEMRAFFSEYDLTHTLLSFTVVKQEKKSMLVRAEQKTINQGNNEFRNHISEANHTFVLEDSTWKIKETVMTNTEFLD